MSSETADLTGHRIATARLLLRPLEAVDAATARRLAGDKRVALMTARIPHPYPEGLAETWIAETRTSLARGDDITLALEPLDHALLRDGDTMIGTMRLDLRGHNGKGELGYWIGVPYWGQGLATEAARAMVAHGFGALGLDYIWAGHMDENPASGRVLEKVRFTHEGAYDCNRPAHGTVSDAQRYGLRRN